MFRRCLCVLRFRIVFVSQPVSRGEWIGAAFWAIVLVPLEHVEGLCFALHYVLRSVARAQRLDLGAQVGV